MHFAMVRMERRRSTAPTSTLRRTPRIPIATDRGDDDDRKFFHYVH